MPPVNSPLPRWNAPSRPRPTMPALIREHGAAKVRFVATSASRDARNRQVFVDGIRDLLGVEPEVITGDEEAALSFAGASSVLPILDGDQVLVVDLGGGSTEFVLGTADGVTAAKSVDVGCVRLTERHLREDPPTAEQIAAAEADVDAAITSAGLDVPLERATAVVGVAGSITTITAHAMRLPEYSPDAIHGTELPIDDIRRAATDLLEMPRAERAALPYMHPGPGGRHRRRRPGVAAHPGAARRAQRRPDRHGHRQRTRYS